MFSVDNFYTIFNSYYGWPKKSNTIYYFQTHGSKHWADIIPWGDTNETFDTPEHFTHGSFLMHDQEPFDIANVDYLYGHLINDNTLKEFAKKNSEHAYMYDIFKKLFDEVNNDISLVEFSSLLIRTIKIPIICHSEKNSRDIKELENNHWISCYYWYHGMIARDWFRHWERNNDLQVQNKANKKYKFLIYSREFTGTRKYREKIIEHLKKHQAQVNYNWDCNYRCPTLSATIDINDANNSAIQLVAETLFDTEKIYLTEKVFKPMVMCQPFILFGPPKSLQYLRDYGFKTFSDFWSEDYDLIDNASDRKQKILNLVDSLAALPAEQFKELYQDLLPIIDHNRKHFYSKEFQDLLWNELQKNCSEALLKQQELSEQLPGGNWMYYVNQIFERTGYYSDRWHTNLNYFVEHNNVSVEKFKLTYPKLFEHYQSQKYGLDNKS